MIMRHIRRLISHCSHESSSPLLHKRRPTDLRCWLIIHLYVLFNSDTVSYTFNGLCILQPCKDISSNKRHSSPTGTHSFMLVAVSLIGEHLEALDMQSSAFPIRYSMVILSRSVVTLKRLIFNFTLTDSSAFCWA